MSFEYTEIERLKTIDRDTFYREYYKKQKPVVVEKLTEDWAATKKWNFDYIKQVAGDVEVPLYDNNPVDYTKKVNEPVAKMKMSEYIDILHKGPTDLRIFLFNLMKKSKELKDDIQYPDLKVKILKELPMLFFGGENSNVFMHYDLDFANIFHFHFIGKKRCVLVPHDQSKYMYRLPYAWISHEDINFSDPDFEKWPALKNIKPLVAHLNHGDFMYMPEGYWHYMQYLTPGVSLSLRSIPHKPLNLYKALRNLLLYRNIDNYMRNWKKDKWIKYKNNLAIIKTNQIIKGKY